jgi:uncharacterized phage protein (TIGR02218 family)
VKVIPDGLAAHYATRATTLATALFVQREDGEKFGFTSHDVDLTIDGVTYQSSPGLDASAIVIASGAAVGNLELTTLHDETTFTTADILGGRWRNAEFVIFRYNWAHPYMGFDILLAGNLGEIQISQSALTVELRDLRQFLQQPIGSASSKTCRYRLGSTDKNRGGQCLKDVSADPFTMTGTLTGVTSDSVFQDSARTEAADYFGEGTITWTSGNNTGLSARIRDYSVAGTFTLALPMISTVTVGDAYTAVAGCRKRLAEDCVTKFDNVLNFGGEPHRPGIDSLTKNPAGSV